MYEYPVITKEEPFTDNPIKRVKRYSSRKRVINLFIKRVIPMSNTPIVVHNTYRRGSSTDQRSDGTTVQTHFSSRVTFYRVHPMAVKMIQKGTYKRRVGLQTSLEVGDLISPTRGYVVQE